MARRKKNACKLGECKNYREYAKRSCGKCRSRKWRIENPIRYAFNNVRGSARKRKIPFKLTFEEFKGWAIKSGYMERKGRDWNAYTIDRINSAGGYTLGNIRIATWGENSVKSNSDVVPNEPF